VVYQLAETAMWAHLHGEQPKSLTRATTELFPLPGEDEATSEE
jgi:hypothetical protein